MGEIRISNRRPRASGGPGAGDGSVALDSRFRGNDGQMGPIRQKPTTRVVDQQQVKRMAEYSVAEAKNTLPKLIDRALAGEEVVITRRGKRVAEIKPAAPSPSPPAGTHDWLFDRTASRPPVGLTSLEIIDLLYEQQEP